MGINNKKKNIGKFLILGFSVIILILLVVATQYLGFSFKREITVVGKDSNISITNLGHIGSVLPFSINKERVNFLFLGIAGEGNPAPQLTDTIILINSTPKAGNPIAISIPRDLLVKYPDKNYYTKINALYKYGGIDAIKTGVIDVTGLEADYYLVADLDCIKKIVDKLGGLDIEVKEDIYDPKFPGQYDSFETFSLKKGLQHLDGETVLKYIRTRNQAQGDFSRIARQQQVINALKNKILSLNFILNFPKILGIWNILQENAYTNIGLGDIKYAWNLIKKTNLDEIEFNTIAPPLVVSDNMVLGGEAASVLKPKSGINNYKEIKNYINSLISQQ